MPAALPSLAAGQERQLAAGLFNLAWVTGDAGKAAEHVALARAQSARISDAEDRAILDSDLATLVSG